MELYQWSSFSTDGFFHLARVNVKSDYPALIHTHVDMAEVFWVEEGFGTHLINGQSQPLRPGDLICIRPDDVHAFRASSSQSICLINFAFHSETLTYLQQRYFANSDSWPWQPSELPASFVLQPEQISRFREYTELLSTGAQTLFDLEWFLLQVLHLLVSSQSVQIKPQAQHPQPPWLQRALIRFREPQSLSLGVNELARLCQRSPEHVNRVLRTHCGKTTTAVIQDMRLEYAAQQLRMSNQPVSKIAQDCGLLNLSHFHRLFRRRFGVSPLQYREREQSVVC